MSNRAPTRFRPRVLLAVLLCAAGMRCAAQTLLMSSGAQWDTCEGMFYDSGGAGGAYGNNQNYTATLCPGGGAGSGAATAVVFTAFAVGSFLDPGDELVVHDGTSTTAPVLATGTTGNSLAGQTFTATGPSGCLTFHWTSSVFGNAAGWEAQVITGPDAGNNGSLTLCSGQPPFPLVEVLGGDPDVGGAWTGPGGPHTSFYDPGNDPGGIYTYVVVDGSGCADSATVSITLLPSPDAGDDGTLLICDASGPVNLLSSLAGSPDPGGTWTGPNGVHSGVYDPAVDDPGTYTYALPPQPPCPSASAVVQVSETGQPDAGTDGQVVTCDTVPVVVLFDQLGGTPDAGGTWTDLDSTGALFNGVFNANGMPVGTYAFRYTVDVVGCGSDSSTVSATVVQGMQLVDLERACQEGIGTSVISFTITQGGGTGYAVQGVPGMLTTEAPFVFTSDELPDSVAYAIVVVDPGGCGSLSIDVPACAYAPTVFVPESFSPNGDGINETFVIPGLEDFPGNELHIFNRWGSRVFHAVAYHDMPRLWDGTSSKGPDPLPAGTYYYVLELGGGYSARSGFVYLNR